MYALGEQEMRAKIRIGSADFRETRIGRIALQEHADGGGVIHVQRLWWQASRQITIHNHKINTIQINPTLSSTCLIVLLIFPDQLSSLVKGEIWHLHNQRAFAAGGSLGWPASAAGAVLEIFHSHVLDKIELKLVP